MKLIHGLTLISTFCLRVASPAPQPGGSDIEVPEPSTLVVIISLVAGLASMAGVLGVRAVSGSRLIRLHPGISGLIVLLALIFSLYPKQTAAQETKVLEAVENGIKVAPKQGTALPEKPFPPENATGSAGTFFAFHPGEPVATVFSKNVRTNIVNPSPFTHNYSEMEIHGTTGKVTYDIGLGDVMENGQKKKVTKATATAEITPGNNKGEKVLITSRLRDPITFSDSNPNSQFDFVPGGLNDSFSLLKATSFPSVFAPDLDTFGAIAAETSMMFQGRVTPGVITNPDTFWSDGLSGAIDLFTLLLTSDASHHVTAGLSFSSGTSDFTLDYKNQAGMSFNPFDPADPTLKSIDASISSAFGSDGTLTADLSDLFTVGFVPNGPTEFSLGWQDTLVLTSSEVPAPVREPGTGSLLATGITGLLILGWRLRKQGVYG